MAWSTPTAITPATKISDTDDIIEANAQDLEAYVNGTSPYSSSTGLTANMVDKATPQTITAQKTFSTAIVATGGVTGDLTGNVTGDVTGNSGTSTLATDSLALNGEVVTDSVVSTSTTIPAALNSAKTAYDRGSLGITNAASAQATDSLALNGEVVTDSVVSTSTTIPAALNSAKTAYDRGSLGITNAASAQATADSKILPTAYATSTVGGTVKARLSGTTLYLTINGATA